MENRNRSFKKLLILGLLAAPVMLIAGCGSSSKFFQPVQVSQHKGVINVYRKGNVFSRVKVSKVFLDGKSIGSIGVDKHKSVAVTPGTHEIEVIEALSLRQQATGGNKVMIKVKPGKQYYVRLGLRTSSIVRTSSGAHHNAVFVPVLVAEDIAKQEIAGTRAAE